MNININMGEILSKAWKITWKFKVLWIFGILAGCGASNRGSSFNNGGSGGRGTGNPGGTDLPEPFKQFQNMNWQEAVTSFLSQYWIIIAVIVLAVFLLSFLFYFLGVMGKTGLIKGTHKADQGAEKLGFGELWNESLPYLWRTLGMDLLVGIPILIAFLLLLVVFFVGLFGVIAGKGQSDTAAMGGLFTMLAVFVPAICCLSIVSTFIGMMVEQAKNAMVTEDLGVFESLRRGWNVFKKNFLTIIIMSIILAVITGVIGFISSIPLIIAVVPAGISFFMLASNSADMTASLAPLVIAGICTVAYLPVLLVLRGVAQTYTQSALTLTFLRLTAPAPEPPMEPEIINAQ